MIDLYYSEDYARYDFGPDHPLRPERTMLAFKLMEDLGCRDGDDVRWVKPSICSEADLISVHTKDYIEAVKAERPNLSFGLGDMDTPVFNGIYDASRLIAGGSIQAAEAMISGDSTKAFNLGGGLHHAFPSKAGGFCVFNDPALAIHTLKKKFQRVLYIDIDAHHADGVQDIFYQDPMVLKISMHESGKYLFPGTGFIEEVGSGPGRGYTVNMPMPRYSGDEAYLCAFGEIAPALVSWFKPEAVVAQIGVDTHYSDPLTSLRLSLQGYSSLVKSIIDLADKYAEGRLLALGGGGYSIRAVPIAWASAFQMMRGKSLYYLSQNWVEMFQLETRTEPISLEDLAPGGRPEVGQWICSQLNEVLSGLKSILHDIHGGHGLTFISQAEILP